MSMKSVLLAAALCVSAAAIAAAPAEARPSGRGGGGGGGGGHARFVGAPHFSGPRFSAPRVVAPRVFAPQRFAAPRFVPAPAPQQRVVVQHFGRPGFQGPAVHTFRGGGFGGHHEHHFWRGRSVWFGLPFPTVYQVGYIYDDCWQSVQTPWGWGWINLCDPNWSDY